MKKKEIMKPQSNEDYISKQEAMKLLEISEPTMRRYIKEGIIRRAGMFRHRVYYYRQDVIAQTQLCNVLR